mmetsp:Transcript_1997/g.4074  ORF Transcript_1997/g.4074 Transcript_1997/m.4074 type:complete len:97 (-) Transcript_1997:54-344(-)
MAREWLLPTLNVAFIVTAAYWVWLYSEGRCMHMMCFMPFAIITWLLGVSCLLVLVSSGQNPSAKALTKDEVKDLMRRQKQRLPDAGSLDWSKRRND